MAVSRSLRLLALDDRHVAPARGGWCSPDAPVAEVRFFLGKAPAFLQSEPSPQTPERMAVHDLKSARSPDDRATNALATGVDISGGEAPAPQNMTWNFAICGLLLLYPWLSGLFTDGSIPRSIRPTYPRGSLVVGRVGGVLVVGHQAHDPPAVGGVEVVPNMWPCLSQRVRQERPVAMQYSKRPALFPLPGSALQWEAERYDHGPSRGSSSCP